MRYCRRHGQAGEKAGLVAQRGDRGVVRVARLPVGQNDHAGTKEPQYTHNLEAIFERIFDRSVGQIERLPPANAQEASGFGGFAGAFFRVAAGSGLALGQIENGGAQAA